MSLKNSLGVDFCIYSPLINVLPLNQILVFGGNGFVGSHVCKEAIKRGITVSSLSRYHILITLG